MEIKSIFTYYTVINLDNLFNSEVSNLYEMFKEYHFFNCYPYPTEFYIKFKYSYGEDSFTILNHFLNEGTTFDEFKEIMNGHYSKLSKRFQKSVKYAKV